MKKTIQSAIVIIGLAVSGTAYATDPPAQVQQSSNVKYYIQRIAAMETDIGTLLDQTDKLKAENEQLKAEIEKLKKPVAQGDQPADKK